ncbi:hypothetical protein Pcinc_006317 [Petrolisthes cinctipes]|uniref:Uncharacterized protein n=1 Tax=Petrolisthes cinctipes TaxID=88211 RepID=A0AAE1GBW6_PETCI|nr:hypothetical protein Pcinc_006317 [Petrolisthes cinctipes]
MDTPMPQVKESQPTYTFEIYNQCYIQQLLDSSTSNAFDECIWAKEFKKHNTEGTVLLHGIKTVEKIGVDIQPSPDHHVVKAVQYRCHLNMLIHFKEPIDDDTVSKFKKSLIKETEKPYPTFPKSITESWEKSVICPPGLECKTIFTPVYGLREFLRYLKDSSNISQYPETTTILKPFTATLPVSYPSAVKFEGPQYNKTCEFKENISLVQTTFSSAEPKTFDDVKKMKKCDVSVAGEKRTKDMTEYEECVPKLSRQEIRSSLTISGRESTVVSKSVATNVQNSSSQTSIYSLDNVTLERQNKVSQNKTIHSEEFINESLQSSSDTNFEVPDAGQGKIDNHQGAGEGQTASLRSTTNITSAFIDSSEPSTMQKSSNVVSSLKKSCLPQAYDHPDTHLSGYKIRSLKKKYHDDSVGKLPSGNMTDMKMKRTSDWSNSVDTDKYRMVVDVTSTSDLGTTQITKEKDTIHPKGTNATKKTKEKDMMYPKGTNVTQKTKEKDIMYPKVTNILQMTKHKDTIHPNGTSAMLSTSCPVTQMTKDKDTIHSKGTSGSQITKEKDIMYPKVLYVSQITKEKDTMHPNGTSITCPVSQQSETNHIKKDGQTLHIMSSNNHTCDLSSSVLQPIEEGAICGMTRKYYGTKSVQKEKAAAALQSEKQKKKSDK